MPGVPGSGQARQALPESGDGARRDLPECGSQHPRQDLPGDSGPPPRQRRRPNADSAGSREVREVIVIPDDPEPRTEEQCDPKRRVNGEYPRILVEPCEFVNEKGERERTAPVYLLNTEFHGVGAFVRDRTPKGAALTFYGGAMEYYEHGARSRMPADQGAHLLAFTGHSALRNELNGSHLNSAITRERGWRYYVENSAVGGFINASMEPNCRMVVHPKRCDKVAIYVLQRKGLELKPGEIPFFVVFRALEDLPPGTQLFWDYHCDPHQAPEGAEPIFVDPSPLRA